MSLRGLLWTAPAGYALNVLGLGWHYSLAGSWMGLVYYLGGKTPDWDTDYAKRNLNGQIAWSELYWGWWVWFVLELACVSYVIITIRKHLGARNTCSPAVNLLRTFWCTCYELLIFIINIIFACSVGFYQLVQQKDMKNKGQTFFGLYSGVLFLAFVQAFNWGYWWNRYHGRRQKSRLVRSGSASTINNSADNASNETTPLLPWPQSHPNANQSNGAINNTTSQISHTDNDGNSSRQYWCSSVWTRLEMFIYLDGFISLRWFLGVLSALHTIMVLLMFILCVIMDIDSPRLMPYYKIINQTEHYDYYDYY